MVQLCRIAADFRSKQPQFWWVALLAGALLGIAAGRSLNTSVSVVDGQSMFPTFSPGARVITASPHAVIQRGDVILLDDHQKEYALKRVIGLPGEHVRLWRGFVFVNGRMLSEPYLAHATYTFADEKNGLSEFRLNADEYFVLGDNRHCSVDSRSYGPIKQSSIKAAALMPSNSPRPQVLPFRLPEVGKRTIRSSVSG
jgi:signal peptidase I